MNVQQLIDRLNLVEDKTIPVVLWRWMGDGSTLSYIGTTAEPEQPASFQLLISGFLDGYAPVFTQYFVVEDGDPIFDVSLPLSQAQAVKRVVTAIGYDFLTREQCIAQQVDMEDYE